MRICRTRAKTAATDVVDRGSDALRKLGFMTETNWNTYNKADSPVQDITTGNPCPKTVLVYPNILLFKTLRLPPILTQANTCTGAQPSLSHLMPH